ncbi:AAA family ATPase [Candidatus Electrothrix sp.]|uniref:AAA family ATPase n=1 Tax=Candidatus Electrothrix sp. TaxID=2170559 RepID=UPI0040570934
MITQLEIKNFRGFSEYKIDDVGQVNLLVGTNNCGKTSVLEAVQLIRSKGELSVLFSLFENRGEKKQNEEHANIGYEADLSRIFHQFNIELKSYFSIKTFSKEYHETLSVVVEDDSVLHPYLHEDIYAYNHQHINIRWKNTENKEKKIDYPISKSGGLLPYNDDRLPFHYRKILHFSGNRENDVTVQHVPSSSLLPRKVAAMFDKIVLTSDEDIVIEALQIIEPDIVRLASFRGISFDDYVRGGILVKSSKWEERIPIGSFGDGIWRLLGLILSLVAAKNGTLLIDEIDTGLHHTVMSKMWKLICITARKLNVQVFATTHSSDCWKTLADNAVEDEFADMPIRIHRINKDKESAVTFTNREMHLALNRELEVR